MGRPSLWFSNPARMSSTEKTAQRRCRWRGPGPRPESGSHVPANSAEDTMSSGSACQPRPEASCTPTRGGRGVDSGLCAVTSTARPQRRQCGRSPTWTSHPGCQAQDTGHARSADHGHPRMGETDPRGRGERGWRSGTFSVQPGAGCAGGRTCPRSQPARSVVQTASPVNRIFHKS